MTPGERVDIIKRVASQLATNDDWPVIHLTLEQFGFAAGVIRQGDKLSYAIHCLEDGKDSKLIDIDEYLMGNGLPGNAPWERKEFRLFLTHVAKRKKEAHNLKDSLCDLGVEAFVAHDDIQAGEEWQAAIRVALRTSDALAGLLHEGFRESPWCDQEVGFALGRGIPALPIQCDRDITPYGFIGSLQAVPQSSKNGMENVAIDLVLALLKDARTSRKLTQAIVERLASATSFRQANTLSDILSKHTPLPSRKQVEYLRKAQKENDQLQGSNDFDGNLRSIEARLQEDQELGDLFDEEEEEPF